MTVLWICGSSGFKDMKIAEAIDRFVDYIAVERRMAAGTVRNYEGDLRDLQAYLLPLEVTELDDLSARDIRGWQMEHLGAGEAAGTVRRRLSSVSSWLRWLRRSGFLEADLMAKVSPPRQPKHLPVFFKESETEHLYDEGLFGTDFTGRRDALMLRMLYETGMRRSELAALREGSVDLGARQTQQGEGGADRNRVGTQYFRLYCVKEADGG